MGQIKVGKEICERDILEAFIGIVINVNGEGIANRNDRSATFATVPQLPFRVCGVLNKRAIRRRLSDPN